LYISRSRSVYFFLTQAYLSSLSHSRVLSLMLSFSRSFCHSLSCPSFLFLSHSLLRICSLGKFTCILSHLYSADQNHKSSQRRPVRTYYINVENNPKKNHNCSERCSWHPPARVHHLYAHSYMWHAFDLCRPSSCRPRKRYVGAVRAFSRKEPYIRFCSGKPYIWLFCGDSHCCVDLWSVDLLLTKHTVSICYRRLFWKVGKDCLGIRALDMHVCVCVWCLFVCVCVCVCTCVCIYIGRLHVCALVWGGYDS